MKAERLRELLDEVAAGTLDPSEAVRRLAWAPMELVGNGDEPAFARLDHHRALRQGVPEVVFCPGKTADEVVEICRRLAAHGNGFLATRADEATATAVRAAFPAVVSDRRARTLHLAGNAPAAPEPDRFTLVVSAGTGDLAVADEAAITASALGHRVDRLYDVGVAGIHRVLGESALLDAAAVVIVVAGMEGALPSVVGGLVAVPVIAVPTSIGYGAAFGGLAALLGMLNSCAAGVTVVNIDNGFGAAMAAERIHRTASLRAGRA
ncbi:MAG TPA: nickel pincer cofactor biosynthesis protein LarB [Longimicrobiales bacterium]|nr:nickel pincer cofactor biosynthesis protein LarB [Longimicrobiales bacterium]